MIPHTIPISSLYNKHTLPTTILHPSIYPGSWCWWKYLIGMDIGLTRADRDSDGIDMDIAYGEGGLEVANAKIGGFVAVEWAIGLVMVQGFFIPKIMVYDMSWFIHFPSLHCRGTGVLDLVVMCGWNVMHRNLCQRHRAAGSCGSWQGHRRDDSIIWEPVRSQASMHVPAGLQMSARVSACSQIRTEFIFASSCSANFWSTIGASIRTMLFLCTSGGTQRLGILIVAFIWNSYSRREVNQLFSRWCQYST